MPAVPPQDSTALSHCVREDVQEKRHGCLWFLCVFVCFISLGLAAERDAGKREAGGMEENVYVCVLRWESGGLSSRLSSLSLSILV